MIFKYYFKNISYEDVIYSSGVGYSLCYADDILKYFPLSGTFLSQWPLDRRFVSSLYGLEYETWIPDDSSLSFFEIWDIYWKKIKEYITNYKPVTTAVDVLSLPSTRELMNNILWLNAEKIPNFLLKIISTAHEIVIVGFDEEKKLIYYNDPVAAVLGNSNKGTYATAPLDDFISAVLNTRIGQFNPKFILNTYKKVKSPLSNDIIFKKSHERNLKKIKGNPEYYDEKWKKYSLGSGALKSYIKNVENIVENRINDILPYYRTNTFKFAVMKKTCQFLTNKSNHSICNDSFTDPFQMIVIEKKYMYDYLRNKSKHYDGLENEISYFSQELELWKKLSNSYLRFYKEFTFSKKKNKMMINKNFIKKFIDILEIENKIN